MRTKWKNYKKKNKYFCFKKVLFEKICRKIMKNKIKKTHWNKQQKGENVIIYFLETFTLTICNIPLRGIHIDDTRM